MALFFTFKAAAPDKVPVLGAQWHTKLQLLAVCTGDFASPGKVTIHGDEGGSLHTISTGAEGKSATCDALAWHPTLQVLVMGWKDGTLLLWSCSEAGEPCSQEVQTPHRDRSIRLVCWNSAGDRVITGDSQGGWGVWRYERETLILSSSSKGKQPLEGALTHVVFRTRSTENRSSSPEVESSLVDQRLMVMDEEEAGAPPASASAGNVVPLNEACTWFIGGSAGTVWGLDDEGSSGEIMNIDSLPILSLLFHSGKTGVVAMNQACSVCYYVLREDKRWVQQAKFRISFGKGSASSAAQMAWIGPGLLAATAHESLIRVWNIDANENYIISTQDESSASPAEHVSCIAYNHEKRTIAAGCRSGSVLFWQYAGREVSVSEEDWVRTAEIKLEEIVTEVKWGPGESLLAAVKPDVVSILHGTSLKRCLNRDCVLVQLTPDMLLFEDLNGCVTLTATSKIRIKGVALSGSHFVVWNTKQFELFHIQMNNITSLGIHNVENTSIALHVDKVLVARSMKGVSTIEMYNLQLSKLPNLSIKAHEGELVQISVNGDFLVAATSKNYVNCWWIGGRAGEEKPHGYPKLLWESNKVCISCIAVNCNGTQVAVMTKVLDSQGLFVQDTKLHLYSLEHDTVTPYDFDELERLPISVTWDEYEPRLFACELRKNKKKVLGAEEGDHPHEDGTHGHLEVAAMFSSNKGVQLQERFPMDRSYTALIGLSVPNFCFYSRESRPREIGKPPTNVVQRVMRDFEGIDSSDSRVKNALLDFSFNLACGDMDAAYRAVKLIKDENVWTNMAQMCVKTGRLDVAEVCLGNMQDAKGARSLREAKKEPEVEAHLAMLALQLGLVEDAERLYKKCGRYDLLNQMFQACGKWSEAIELAEQHDRIHLRTIHYAHAKHLETIKDYTGAIRAYEKAKCHAYEVPRMLYDAGRMEQLEQYATTSSDKDVFLWWAQFCESNRNYEPAFHFYKEAGDTVSRVRLHCLMRDLDAAANIVESSKDTGAAAYHLAKQYEEAGKMKETLQFYRIAKAYKNAIRIARANKLDADVMQLSLLADQATFLDSAQWFEEQGMLDKAVVLYKKGGQLAKAIDLCVRGELFDTLQKLADDLDKDTDPDVFLQCAEFFMSKNQNEKAVNMYIQAKSYSEALQVCLDREVKLTEDMAEEMTLPKTDNDDDEAQRLNLLRKIAKVAKQQESWHLACKKYTQAGDRIKGMKVLLKSGDTDKIIFFTNHSRQKDIYILAANYLQTCDWHNNSNITKQIIAFYTKARAYESLSGFYDAIAQVYIDEFRDYDKALGALQDALKYMEKSKAQNRDMKMRELEGKVNYVEQFVEARNLVKSDPGKMVEMCKELLEVEDVEEAVRVGDVYALLVEFYTGQSDFENAYQYIERMRDKQIILSYYLETELVQAVYNAMGVEYKEQEQVQQSHAAAPHPDDLADEVDEELPSGGEGGAE